jgi:hypothetical protein
MVESTMPDLLRDVGAPAPPRSQQLWAHRDEQQREVRRDERVEDASACRVRHRLP